MKKIIKIVILASFVICLSACGIDNTELITSQEVIAINKIADVENVKTQNIKESINYIKENINNAKDKKVLKQLAYHANYLNVIGSKSELNKNHIITSLGNTTKNYLTKLSKKEKKNVDKLISDIEDDIDSLSEEFYNNYHTTITINNAIKLAEIEVATDLVDSKKVNRENISKAIEYISTYINEPLKNSEVIEKIVYYSEYLIQLGKNEPHNEITLLGTYTKEYLKKLDNNAKKSASNMLKEINKDRKNKIEKFYNLVK